MQRILHANSVITYTFDSLTGQSVQAHVSTRHGGVSPAPWNTLNFSVKRGDTPERVAANRARLAEAVGVDPAHIVSCRQVHGTGIAKVDWSDAGQTQDGSDGLMTNAAGLPLALVFADCVPVLIFDPVNRALGVVHEGWRGTVNGAAEALLWSMQAAYGSEPERLHVCIGPSIGPESYQVGPEVEAMAQVRLHNAAELFQRLDGADANPYFDLWRANATQMETTGVPAARIEVAGIDTATNTHDFFSHRAEQGQCGLFSMIAWLDREDE